MSNEFENIIQRIVNFDITKNNAQPLYILMA